MADDTDPSQSPELSEPAYSMLTDHQMNQFNSGRQFSGDGTWTGTHIIVALVGGQTEDEALANAVAAFAHRDGRPDPLFEHSKTDTFDLAVELESLTLAVPETPWEDHPPVMEVPSEETDDAFEQICSDSNFEADDSIVFNRWGEKLTSEDEFQSAINSLDTGWLIAGVGLKPTGAGQSNDDYIGNIYEIRCPTCESLQDAECVNLAYNDRQDEHEGVWTCEKCGENFRGVNPQGPAEMQSELTERW